MNLDNLKSGWQQYKVMNSLDRIEEAEILAIVGTVEQKTPWQLHRRVVQNTLIYTFLLTCFSGGCTF
jgi:hypothetical protein